MRDAIDIGKESAMKCPKCNEPIPVVDPRQRSNVCYCSKCDAYYELSFGGTVLRSFKKQGSQLVSIGENTNE